MYLQQLEDRPGRTPWQCCIWIPVRVLPRRRLGGAIQSVIFFALRFWVETLILGSFVRYEGDEDRIRITVIRSSAQAVIHSPCCSLMLLLLPQRPSLWLLPPTLVRLRHVMWFCKLRVSYVKIVFITIDGTNPNFNHLCRLLAVCFCFFYWPLFPPTYMYPYMKGRLLRWCRLYSGLRRGWGRPILACSFAHTWGKDVPLQPFLA